MQILTRPDSAIDENAATLCAFYTRDAVGAALISSMGAEAPATAVDLGAGPGCLSNALARRWSACEIVTVDIDASVRSVAGDRPAGHRHVVMDALHPDLPAKLMGDGLGFDVSVSNPPYGGRIVPCGASEILKAAGLEDVHDARTLSPGSEILFLGQSLRLTRTGGRIGVIVPDSVITGRAAAGLRRALAERHRIERVVQLPRGSFKRTDTQAFLMILLKDGLDDGAIVLQRLSRSGAACDTIHVATADAERRLDHRYHAQTMRPAGGSRASLVDLGATVVRGRHPGGAPGAFHTNDFPSGSGARSVSFGDRPIDDPLLASPGDILLARIGRNLARKVCIIETGCTTFTDCVYRLRLPRDRREGVHRFLSSEAGEAALAGHARGTGALMLGKAELLDMPVPT